MKIKRETHITIIFLFVFILKQSFCFPKLFSHAILSLTIIKQEEALKTKRPDRVCHNTRPVFFYAMKEYMPVLKKQKKQKPRTVQGKKE